MTGLLQAYCKECNKAKSRAYYSRNGAKHKAAVSSRNRAVRKLNQERVWDYLTAHPCVDCGETDPVVLEFDHLRDKIDNIATMLKNQRRWPVIFAEIQKCEVRCANCHRRKTAREYGWYQNLGKSD